MFLVEDDLFLVAHAPNDLGKLLLVEACAIDVLRCKWTILQLSQHTGTYEFFRFLLRTSTKTDFASPAWLGVILSEVGEQETAVAEVGICDVLYHGHDAAFVLCTPVGIDLRR